MKKFLLALAIASLLIPNHAAAQAFRCDKSAAITAPADATTVVVPAVAGQQVDVCGFVITADTNNSSATFVSGTSKTGAFRLNAGTPLTSPGGFAFSGPVGLSVSVTTTTGGVTGLLVYRQ